ncbi:MAG: Tol-Pal system beta propeller repeat protein TolB [Nitrospinae bacterium]|nr:Tol-Pal system beta propeller repeat protein TolB [Nitrospinota bacterium]
MLLSCFGWQSALAGSAFTMRLSRTGSQRVAIAIPPLAFSGEPTLRHLSQATVDIIKNDLTESTYFSPLDDEDIMRQLAGIDREKGYIDFPEWSSIGAEILLKGKVSADRNSFSVECELYDLYDMNRKIVIRETGPLNNYRQVVHRISDKIIWEIFGEKGISTTKITFISRDKLGYKQIYISDYDGQNLRQITRNRAINLFPNWSPDAKKISYTSFKMGNPDLYLLDLETGKDRAISAESGINSNASWSPDGKSMVLSMSISGNPEIYRLDLENGERRKLTQSRGIDTSPEWSPDGRRVAFTSSRSGTPQIYVMDIQGWNIKRVTYDGSYNDQASWSPDGTKISYSSMNNGHFDIYMINLSTNETRQLTKSSGNDESPSWSPDGRRIAFSSDRNGSYQLFVMEADGGNQHKIMSLDGGGYDPAWSPHLN